MRDRTLKDFSVRNLHKNSASLQASQNRFKENIGTLKNRASFSDEVNKDEPNTYTFKLNRQTRLEVTLENEESLGFFDVFGTKKRVQAELFNNNGKELKSTDRIRPEDEDDFNISLKPGTYSIKITGRSEKDVEYELKLRTGNNSDDDDDDNDDDFDD